MYKKQIFLLAILLLMLDQMTKYMCLQQGNIEFVQNEGIAFGIEQNSNIIIISNIFILIILGIMIKKTKQKNVFFCLNLIIAGGVGNILDRITKGYVIDFINIGIFNFPKFNMADCYIVIGSFLLFYYLLKK